MVQANLSASEATEAVKVLRDIYARGYRLTVRTRKEVYEHKDGVHVVLYAEKLQVRGDDPIPAEIAEAIRTHRDELLTAACVIDPPGGAPWLKLLLQRYRSGEEIEVRRGGWKGPCSISLPMVAANVAAFIGGHPAEDGPRLEPIIQEVLGQTEGSSVSA